MKLARLSLAVVLAVASSSVVACGGSVETPQTTANAGTKAPVGQNTHGMVKLAGEALGEVPLRTEQRTELEKIATETDQRHAALADGRKELANTIADMIEKGAIDRAALQPKIDRVAADFEKVRPADQAALARVHAILDADQRNAFVDALEKRMHEARGEHRKGKGMGKGGPGGFGHMMKLADDLKLTDAQREQIKDVMKEAHKEHARGENGRGDHERQWKAHEARGGERGPRGFDAFRSDKFDPAAQGPQGDVKQHVAEGTTRMLGFAEKVLPILTPEQRKIAADKIRAMSEGGETPFAH